MLYFIYIIAYILLHLILPAGYGIDTISSQLQVRKSLPPGRDTCYQHQGAGKNIPPLFGEELDNWIGIACDEP